MSNKFTLLVDMDGVICDWYGGVLRKYQELYPRRPIVSPENLRTFGVEDHYPAAHRADLMAASRMDGLYAGLDPLPGAIEALKDMEQNCSDFLEPFLCSAPDVDYSSLGCHSEKAGWVEKHLGPWWTRRLVLTKDKTLVRGNVLIDDKPNITGVMTPVWQHLLFDQPYNRSETGPRFSWPEWDMLKELFRPQTISSNSPSF
jgi:5'-nucleotidase